MRRRQSRETKRLLLDTFDTGIETQLEREAQAIARCARTEDSRGAVQAVMDRGDPEFHGR